MPLGAILRSFHIDESAASVFRDRVGRGDERCARHCRTRRLSTDAVTRSRTGRPGSRRDCRDSASHNGASKECLNNEITSTRSSSAPARGLSQRRGAGRMDIGWSCSSEKISPLSHRRITYPIHVSSLGTARPDPGDEILRRSCANTASSSPRPPGKCRSRFISLIATTAKPSRRRGRCCARSLTRSSSTTRAPRAPKSARKQP